MSTALHIYYDFASPFCYIARAVVAQLRARHALTVQWRPFEVIDYLPPAGALPQNPAFVRRNEARQALARAAALGLTLHVRERLLNSNLALCAVEHARTVVDAGGPCGLEDAVHEALFSAYYRDQRDVGSLDEVVIIAAQAGLDAGLRAALEGGVYRERVAHAKRAALDLGVVAVPTFVCAGYAVVGVPALSAFEELVHQASGASTA